MHQNILVENQLSSLSSFEKNNNDTVMDSTVLDAYHLNILRPDQHQHVSDCLHNCLPGPVQVYNRLLWHWLTQSRSMEDVETLENVNNFPWNRTGNFHLEGQNVIVHPTQ